MLNRDRASIWDDEKVLGMGGGGGCITKGMYLLPLHCTLKNG